MLDKTVPYYPVIMRRPKGTSCPSPELAGGFSIQDFQPGDEEHWARIETSAGEFEHRDHAIALFRKEYLSCASEVPRRTIFLADSKNAKIGTLTNWWAYRGRTRDPWLQWIAVVPEFQGRGLGKALIFEGIKRMIEIEGDRDFFLPTQTWSYTAISIYLKAGFEICREPSLGGYKNQPDQAIQILRSLIAGFDM